MIDLHCHVLPGLDDGPATLADSIAMVRQADADGITTICATPHIRADHDVVIGELADRVAALNAALPADVSTEVVTGGEVGQHAALHLDDDELRAVSLGGGGRWVLLEPAAGPITSDLNVTVERLVDRGFRSVIAHPERHLCEGLLDHLADACGAGALVQVTAATLRHPSTMSGMAVLADAGLVHVLGTDAHTSHAGRPVTLRADLAALADHPRTAPHLEWIGMEAPFAIIRGEDITPPFTPTAAVPGVS